MYLCDYFFHEFFATNIFITDYFQVSDVMYYLDNRAYVFRSYEVICDAAFELIHSSKHGKN